MRRKGLISLLVSLSLLIMAPVGANATTTGWQGDNSSGWWYVDDSGNYVTGWKHINQKWYFFDEQGWMAHDTTINGYIIDSTGVWVTQQSSSNGKVNRDINTAGGSADNIKSGASDPKFMDALHKGDNK